MPGQHRRQQRIVLDQLRRRLRQRTAEDSRPSLLRCDRHQAQPHCRDRAKDADRRAAQANQHPVAEQSLRHERL